MDDGSSVQRTRQITTYAALVYDGDVDLSRSLLARLDDEHRSVVKLACQSLLRLIDEHESNNAETVADIFPDGPGAAEAMKEQERYSA